jgi:hypothetical protein
MRQALIYLVELTTNGRLRNLLAQDDSGKSDHTVTTGHRDFNRGPVFCDAKQRDNSAGDKPGVIDRGADIKKDTARFEADSLKVGLQSFIDSRRERGQQLVGAYKLHRPCKPSFQSSLRC